MKQLGTAMVVLGLAAMVACQENLNSPGECPDLCPGEQILVKDTVILATAGADSTYFGFLDRSTMTALMVSDGLAAGEYRSFVVFPTQRTDSITVTEVVEAFTVDTVAITFALARRDSTATGLTVFLHRIPITTDTTVTFDGLNQLIEAGQLIDSIMVPDSVKFGAITAFITDSNIAKLAVPEADSGRIGFALTVRASKPTGVILSIDPNGSASAPSYQSRGHIESTDSARRNQTTEVRPKDFSKYGWVTNVVRTENPDPDLLYLGGPTGARVLLRFAIPKIVLDSAQILRATIELTPAFPLNGLPNSPQGDSIVARGVLIDLGAKSPPLLIQGLTLAGGIKQGTADSVAMDFFQLAIQWQGASAPPAALFVASNEELLGGGFIQPVFFSSRSPTGRPRLRLTYGVPTRPGRP